MLWFLRLRRWQVRRTIVLILALFALTASAGVFGGGDGARATILAPINDGSGPPYPGDGDQWCTSSNYTTTSQGYIYNHYQDDFVCLPYSGGGYFWDHYGPHLNYPDGWHRH